MNDNESESLTKTIASKMVEEVDKICFIAAKIFVIHGKYGNLSDGAFNAMFTDFEKLILAKIGGHISVAGANMPSYEAKVINEFMRWDNGRAN